MKKKNSISHIVLIKDMWSFHIVTLGNPSKIFSSSFKHENGSGKEITQLHKENLIFLASFNCVRPKFKIGVM